jgi:RNA polymerase sigma factor (sigma-70 family)
MTEPGYEATRSAIEAVWRIESPRLIAGLARITGDVGAAEELAQDALVIALQQWPARGVPDGPGAWLMATAKHRAIDLVRRRARYEQKLQEIGRDLESRPENFGEPDVDTIDDHIGDDLLRLIFISCHPVLSPEARAALTLRLLGGLTTHEIARAFLVPEPTIAQRIVRAKRTLPPGRPGSRSRREASSRAGWPPSWRSSTCCSTRAMRPRRARTGCGRRCAPRRCASAGSWPG